VLQQVDRPKRLYDHPATLFVARFIGSPPMNVVPADTSRHGDDLLLDIGDDRLRIEKGVRLPGIERYVGDGVLVGIRPERLSVAGPDAPFHHCLHPRVAALEDLGADTILHLELPDGRELVAKVPSPVHASAGNPLELVVDTRRLHFFDPHDARAVR
jgi:ABC-type sugar transport system ATPase subunit